MGVVFGKSEAESPLLQVMEDHGGGIECMTLNEELGLLATGSHDNTVRLWSIDGERCQPLHTMRGHMGRVTSVMICDTSVVSSSVDKTIRRWEIASGRCVFVCNGHLAQVNRILCTSDFIFSASYDKTSRCWDMETGECLRVFRGHQRAIFTFMFVPVDDVEEIDGYDTRRQGALGSRDMLITASGDGTARSWSIETSYTLRTFSGHTNAVTSLCTDPDGQTLFTGSMDMTIRSWVLKSGRPLHIFNGHEGPILYITVVNKTLYSASSDTTARSWVRDLGEPLQVFRGHSRAVARICVYKGVVFTASSDGFIHAYEQRNATLKKKFEGHEFAVNCIAISNGRLYSASDDATVRVWSLEEGRPTTQPDRITIGSRRSSPTNTSTSQV